MSIELLIQSIPRRPGTYRVYLGDTLIGTSRLPFYDGARILLRLGYEADLLLTMRHKGSAHPSFVPVPISQAARLTVRENDKDSLRVRLYEAYPASRKENEVQPNATQSASKPAASATSGKEAVLGA